MQIEFPLQVYERADVALAPSRLANLLVEQTAAGPTTTVRISRPGLVRAYALGTGPVWGMFSFPGVFNGDRFALSGINLYREGAKVGAIPQADRICRWAASSTQLVVASGGAAYCYNGSTLIQVVLPDGGYISEVVYLASRFYYLEKNTDKWYFSALSNATSVDALAFSYTDEAPDANVGAAVLADEVWFFGQRTVEPWYQTGDQNNPLQRAQGRTYTKGCPAQQSIVKLDNALFFVDSDRMVCRTGSVPVRVSTHGVEAKLRACTAIYDTTAYAITTVDGHALYVLNIPGQTSLAYDVAGGSWAEWTSYEQTLFRGRSACQQGAATYLGDTVDGSVWRLTPDHYSDGDDPLERIVSGTVLTSSGSVRCDNIALQGSKGIGLSDGIDPQAQMRYSDDGGETWGDWISSSLGEIGDYSIRTEWKKLGSIRSPGRTFEFRVTDPIAATFAGATMNERRI